MCSKTSTLKCKFQTSYTPDVGNLTDNTREDDLHECFELCSTTYLKILHRKDVNELKYWEQEMFSLCQCTSARNF